MTNMKTTSILTVMISVSLLAISATPMTSAHSQPNDNNFFTSGTQSLCYATGGLGYLKYNGSTGHGQLVENQIKIGMDELSDNTDMNLSETSSCSGYKSWVTSYYDPITGNGAKTSVLFTTLGNEYKTMQYNNNQYAYWVTNGGCSTISLDLSNIANHEFGHFAGLSHQSGGSSHTMMSTSCNSGYSSIKVADEAYINDRY